MRNDIKYEAYEVIISQYKNVNFQILFKLIHCMNFAVKVEME